MAAYGRLVSIGLAVTCQPNQFTGLNAITVPGTLRDSLILLAVVFEQQTELQPTQIMTDSGAYSDVVFGLFRLLVATQNDVGPDAQSRGLSDAN